MKTAAVLALTAVVLAGCAATGAPAGPVPAAGGSPTSDSTTPIVTAVGTSPIGPDMQAAFCRDQVAYMYSTELQRVTARERMVAADGSTTIDVIVDKGSEGVRTFKCRLDASNRFVDVIAATSDGA